MREQTTAVAAAGGDVQRLPFPGEAGFTAEGTLNREDWGLTWNMPVDNGGLLVSK